MKLCGAQVRDSTGELHTCDKPLHLWPVCRDGDVRMIGIPGLWFLGALVIGPNPKL